MVRFWTPAVLSLTVLVTSAACGQEPEAREFQADPTIQEYFHQLRGAFSGERALETVAFMEGTFRLPGNSGFDASLGRVAEILESAGYVLEDSVGPNSPLTYRIETRPLSRPTWEPVAASLDLTSPEPEPLLRLDTNLNMVAINSYSTPEAGVEAEVVYVGDGSPEAFRGRDVSGRIVFGESSVRRLFAEAVQRRGALGVLSYSMPGFNQPQENPSSIQFSSIPLDPTVQSWGLRLSYGVKERLKAALERGPVRVRVRIQSRIFESQELTLVADVHGTERPQERFVLSAHVQEPGANDNASGVAVQAEVARVLGRFATEGTFRPRRTVSMVWGDEISSTRRYVEEDTVRAAGILWGVSLDMVGEDTEKTGGTFLIEKMPDPSTIWPRGRDQHTEWFGDRPSSLTVQDLTPHYLNDFVLARCLDQAAVSGWVVRTNPFEGGSDHVPFLRAGIPGLLLWHFTDQFYHTDGDRLDKVSARTMANVGIATAASVMTLTDADGVTARHIVAELEQAARDRLATELELSRKAIAAGGDREQEAEILTAWLNWYLEALPTTLDIEVSGSSPETRRAVEAAVARLEAVGREYLRQLGADGG